MKPISHFRSTLSARILWTYWKRCWQRIISGASIGWNSSISKSIRMAILWRIKVLRNHRTPNPTSQSKIIVDTKNPMKRVTKAELPKNHRRKINFMRRSIWTPSCSPYTKPPKVLNEKSAFQRTIRWRSTTWETKLFNLSFIIQRGILRRITLCSITSRTSEKGCLPNIKNVWIVWNKHWIASKKDPSKPSANPS